VSPGDSLQLSPTIVTRPVGQVKRSTPAPICGQCPENFDSINHFFLIGQMIVPGSSYWNIGIGRAKGEVEQDKEGLRTMEALGQNMAWLLKKIHP
jgi:multimeric flavodoxin WrbA